MEEQTAVHEVNVKTTKLTTETTVFKEKTAATASSADVTPATTEPKVTSSKTTTSKTSKTGRAAKK